MSAEQRLIFESSGLDATIKYLKRRTRENFHALVASPGNNFAYRHFQWSNMDTKTSPKEFWKRMLGKILDEVKVIQNASKVKNYLLSENQSRWLPGILEYLPRGHVFNLKIYMNLGYDNIAYGEDIALNLNHPPFLEDYNEAVYYLMHELAHAGYLTYHEVPDLTNPRTRGELADNVMFLTHLEGMGVLTPLKLRRKEAGLKDPDYIALLNQSERKKRIKAYFEKLEKLVDDSDSCIEEEDLIIYDQFSCKPQRLWYIAGCHIAQVIEANLGVEKLQDLVKKGSKKFFETYRGLPDPQVIG